ncbi:MAG: N-methyl-L-tryptophan oxidase [Caldilineaceae bacterium]
MQKQYDYIVIGCGGIGSGAAYWLARRAGASVLGLEQYKLGHHNGGSQDHSRIIRLTYHHAKYTRLTPHTYPAWAALEEESGVQIVTRTGSVEAAWTDGGYLGDIETYARAMDAAHIGYERFAGDELRYRYPQFTLERDVDVLWQAQTGIADAAKGNAAHIATARLHGATILDQCTVYEINPTPDGAQVVTAQGAFTCHKLIVTGGAWTNRLLASVGMRLPLTVTQEQVTYYATPHLKEFAVGRFPIFIWHDAQVMYGFPVYGEAATKAAIDASGPSVTPESRTFEPDPVREKLVDDWLARHIPHFGGPKLYTKSCLYTMPPDRDFIIEALPAHPQIILCVGAGHAYKFASLLGKILSQLAIDGRTEYPIGDFTLQRRALTDPAYEAVFHI